MGDSMERDHGVMSPLLVLMSGGSGWSWRLIDQLRRCGLETITVDVNGLRDAGGFVGRAIDYTLPRVRSPRTGPLRRIALAHGTMFGLCLYGGRQAFELDLLSRALPGFRFGVYAGGSDVLRPHGAQSRIRGLLARLVVGDSLSRAALVLANGEHLAATVEQLTRGKRTCHSVDSCASAVGSSLQQRPGGGWCVGICTTSPVRVPARALLWSKGRRPRPQTVGRTGSFVRTIAATVDYRRL